MRGWNGLGFRVVGCRLQVSGCGSEPLAYASPGGTMLGWRFKLAPVPLLPFGICVAVWSVVVVACTSQRGGSLFVPFASKGAYLVVESRRLPQSTQSSRQRSQQRCALQATEPPVSVCSGSIPTCGCLMLEMPATAMWGCRDWVRSLSELDYQQDAVIVAGDVSHHLHLVKDTLQEFRRKFRHVFFVPGNHDLCAPKRSIGRTPASFL